MDREVWLNILERSQTLKPKWFKGSTNVMTSIKWKAHIFKIMKAMRVRSVVMQSLATLLWREESEL